MSLRLQSKYDTEHNFMTLRLLAKEFLERLHDEIQIFYCAMISENEDDKAIEISFMFSEVHVDQKRSNHRTHLWAARKEKNRLT